MIEVKAEERKKPKFMVRRQNAGQYHDIKAVSKFSEVRKIKKKIFAAVWLTDTAYMKNVREDRKPGLVSNI